MKPRFIFLSIFLFACGSLIYSGDVPLQSQAKLMLKIISMDRNFTRYGNPLQIGLSSPAMVKHFNALGSRKVRGRTVVAVKITSPADVAKFKIIHVGKNWARNYRFISRQAVANSCLMCCETESGIKSGGGAVSFRMVNKRARLVVNLTNAKNQGADFSPGFLKSILVLDLP